ncbi:sigma-70 family RNA polymerase sigma factor [Clostridium sp. MSJ-4]|uniref:Sigma-70 family RNA polymerase sigma factor n=1 Tax=Clostridium simiarum TaxID=2841506 RepID=A0ABS6F0M2_9CLOT|nr:sigma-70 family RNA polymerase sigma factor [Clostridium simiarum]MBU5591798.1 sigma-70 family RNA polymerase sigma factor [Clostridium simiarum]
MVLDEDLKLIKEILNGNVDSFNIIVNKYQSLILKFIYNMIKDKEAAEDITQEVFITVYNKLYMYNSKYKFSNWILQIARNKCIDYIRKYKRVYEANIEEVIGLASKEPSPEQKLEFKELKTNVERFINDLGDIDKQILILRYAEELTFLDIAEIMNMSESAVKRRYYKSRDKFKAFFIDKIEEVKGV